MSDKSQRNFQHDYDDRTTIFVLPYKDNMSRKTLVDMQPYIVY